MYSNTVEKTIALLNANAEINTRDHQGKTALIWAFFRVSRNNAKSRIAIINALLDAKADTKIYDRENKQAISYAANIFGKSSEVYKRLLDVDN